MFMFLKERSDAFNISSTVSQKCLSCMSYWLLVYIEGQAELLCSEPVVASLDLSLRHLTRPTSNNLSVIILRCSVIKGEHLFTTDMLLPFFSTSTSMCLDDDSLQSNVIPVSFVSSACSTAALFSTRLS